MTDATDRAAVIDELLDRSVAALNRGDVTAAHDLAERVLAADTSNRDAAALLGVEGPSEGELRRLSLLFCDLVGSTALSARHEPETYRTLIRRYKAVCREVVDRYGGHISHVAGDGMLAVFGLPTPHENDAERAARAGLDIVRQLRRLSEQVEAALGERLEARAAVHRGLVYLDVEEDDIYGLAANVVARLHSLAAPGTVVMSDDVHEIVGPLFETVAAPAQRAKGIDEPLRPHRIVAERPEAPTRGRRWEATLVDRNDELARIRQEWLRVRGGAERPAALHLVGEAGIGKSRLAAVLAEEARDDGAGCLHLLASPFHAEASFHPVRTLVEVRCGMGADAVQGERLARLERELAAVGLSPDELVPLLAPIVGVPPEAGYRAVPLEGRKLHDAIVGASADYVLACLGPGPALLIVEDLHWCDESTLDTLARVLHADRGDLLVVTTSRDAVPSSLGRAEVVELSPLDDTAAAELVLSLDPELDELACRALIDRGDGMPLYLEELTRGVGPIAEGTDEIQATRIGRPLPAASAAVPVGPPSTVPEALYEPLVARLHATGSGLRVAVAAAAIGRDVDHGVLAQVVDVPEPDLDAALEALLGGLILERVLGDGQRYRFRHELLRVAAYELQPPSRRRELHGRVAAALASEEEVAGAVDWCLVASHLDAAGQIGGAITAYQRAADGARRLGALGEARALLSRAIELVPGLPDTRERSSYEVGLRLRRGFLVASAEGTSSPEAMQDYERCLELTLGDTTGDDMFSTLIPLWGYYVLRGDLDRAQQVAEMLRLGVAGGRDHYRPDNEAAFGTIRWFAGDFGAARDQLEAAVEGVATRRISPDYGATYFMPFDGPASAHANLALARFMGGDVLGADQQFDAAQRRCETIEFPLGPFTAAEAHSYAAWTLIERGDLERAAAAVAAVTDIAESHGFDFWSLVGATEQATVAGLMALAAEPRDTAALAAHAQAIEGMCGMWKLLDVALFLPAFTATAGRLRAAAGDSDGAAARYDETLEFARSTGIHFYDAEVLRLRAELLPADEAPAALRAALDLARAQGAAPFELRIAHDLLASGEADGLTLVAHAAARFAPDAHYSELDDARGSVAAAG
jgi:class 3 adenylate cyclase/tetratricopeptide (TPR) repeat protein